MRRILTSLLACFLIGSSVAATTENTVRLPIIMYHHICEDPAYLNEYTITAEQFESDLVYLRDNGYSAVSASQVFDFENGGTLPDKPVMITFDDGFESFYKYAVPLLAKYNMNAVCAIVGKCADTYSKLDDHNVLYSYMTWEEIAEIADTGLAEIANHTYDMHSLGARRGCGKISGETNDHYASVFSSDLDENESRFAEHLGFCPKIFAYPFGIMSRESEKMLTERGYEMIFTCEGRVNCLDRTEGELTRLGRYNRPNGISSEKFFEQIQ